MQPQTYLERLANRISSGAFADDFICLASKKYISAHKQKSYPFTRTGLPSLSQVTGLIQNADKYGNTKTQTKKMC
jgi:hypothetical protein